jgi:tRNA(fMet)-specific endonuclease VapC
MSLFVLDTNILSLFQAGHATVVSNVLRHPMTELAITVISVEEQLSGWYTLIRQSKKAEDVAFAYERLARNVTALAAWAILVFPVQAQARYRQLHAMKLQVRSNDLRIAAITLENGGTLVTQNVRDFQRVPGLTIENWTI